jgi:hypothetical protein
MFQRDLSYDVRMIWKEHDMSDEQKTDALLDNLLKQSIDKTDGQITYANTVSLHVGENEVVLEFYFVLPPRREPMLLQRVVMPLSLGRQLAQSLADGIKSVETSTPAQD